MRTTELARIRSEAWGIVAHPAAKRFEKIEALKLICATKGILIPDLDERFLTVKQALQLRQAKSRIVETALRRKEKAKVINRRAYLRRRLRQLEEGMIAEAGVVAGSVEEEGNNGKDN
jgi:hypothetical protein